MSRVLRATATRQTAFGLVLGLTSFMTNANAGDLNTPDYAPYPNGAPTYERSLDRERYYGAAPPPVYDRAEVGDGACRILHERRVGPYGRETIHRIRICDEGPAYGSPNGAVVTPEYGYRPRSYYERSGYDSYPRPPVPAYSSPNGVVVTPEYEYRPRSYYERSDYDSYPRPPVAIGHGYYR